MRTPRFVVALALYAGAAAPVAMAPAVCAGEGARAALVIDTGAAVTTYCVALPDASVSGLELVELAGDQHGLDYSFGFGGEAVCRLEGVGPEGDDCFGEYPEFWGYWHGNGSGGWSWAGTGAGGATIEDGDVDAWSWGSGDNGSNHQAPPPTEYEDVCAVAAEPAPVRNGGGRSKTPRPDRERSESPPATAAPDAVAGAEPEKPGRRPDRERRGARPKRKGDRREREQEVAPATAAPSPEPTSVAASPASDQSDGGPPLTGLLGLAAAGALGVAAWRGSRRRTGP